RLLLEQTWPTGLAGIERRLAGDEGLEVQWLVPRLQEMVSLGLLLQRRRSDKSCFRLRSESLGTLYGGGEKIAQELAERASSEPTETDRMECWHLPRARASEGYCCLTRRQTTRLTAADAPISLFTAGRVMGADNLQGELQDIASRMGI